MYVCWSLVLTIAAAGGRRLDVAGGRQLQRLSLIDVHAQRRREGPIQDIAEAQRIRIDDARELSAAGRRWHRGVARDETKARRQANQRAAAARLGLCSGPE